MDTTESIVAGIVLAAVVAATAHFGSNLSDVIDQVAPNGIPSAECVQQALDLNGITALEELQAKSDNTSTPASGDIQACVSETQVPEWLSEALTYKE